MKRLALLMAFGLSLRCPLRGRPEIRPDLGSHLTPARKGSAMTNAVVPYYESPDGTIRIFHARWEDVYAAGVFVAKDIALIHADPPYGVNHETDGSKRTKTAPT